MIASANKFPVSQSASVLPNVRNTITGWFRPLELSIVDKSTKDWEIKEVLRTVKSSGVLQPFRATQLAIKPEGERSWRWFMLHVNTDVVLKTDDIVTIRAVKYRVMGDSSYDEYGYFQYELVDEYSRKL